MINGDTSKANKPNEPQKYKLTDVLAIEEIKQLFDSYSQLYNYSYGIVTIDDQKLAYSQGWRNACVKFHRTNEASEKHCIESNKLLNEKIINEQSIQFNQCKNGLVHAGIPIRIQNTHVANLYVGQIFTEPYDKQRFIEQANLYGYDVDQYIKSIEEIPIVEIHQFKKTNEFLALMIETIAEKGLLRLEAKKALDEQKAQADRYNKITQASLDVVFIVDLTGKQLFFSDSLKEILGYDPVEEIGKYFYEHVSVRAIPKYFKQLKKILKGEKINSFITRIRHTDGHYVDVEINGQLIELNGKKLAQGTIRDITKRLQMEDKIALIEQKHKALIEAIPDMIFILDHDANYIDFIPSSYYGTFVEPSEFLGKNVEDIFEGELVEKTKRAISELLKTGKIQVFEYKMLNNGKEEFYEARLVLIGNEVLSLIRDVSKEKMALRESSENEQRLRSLLNAMPDSICFKDGDGKWLETNEYNLKLFNIEGVDYKWKKDSELALFSPFYHDAFIGCEASDEITWKNKKITRVEETIPLPDGSEKIFDVIKVPSFDAEGKREGLLVVGRDISEKKLAQNQNLLLSQALKQNSNTIVITDTDGNIQYVNPMFEQTTGYKYSEAIGKNPRILKSEKQSRSFYKNLWETLTSGKVWSGEFYNKRKDGTFYWEQAIISPIIDETGVITHYVADKIDITEVKKMQEELIKSKEKAEESDRLKTAFLQNMSHEIRTPLNGILGFAQLLSEPLLPADQIAQYSNIIKNSGNRLLELINNILDISKIESGDVKIKEDIVNIYDIINQVGEIIAIKAENKKIEINLKSDYCETDCLVVVDQGKLNQILLNLMNNAVKFTQKGEVTCAYELLESEILFSVKDTGIGMSKEQLDKIFERFYQVDNSSQKAFEGAGLGLAITHSLVKLLKGKIWVESQLGVGSTFYFTIPYVKAKRKDVVNKTKKISLKNTLKVLVAEDDDTSFLFLETILLKFGADVYRVTNGRDAVAFCNVKSVDVVLMDVNMPEMDGLEATKLIKDKHPNLPIIVQTAYAFTTERNEALAIGCDEFISKPINKNELLKTIQKLTKK
ncbi:MAG: PAS domain S-box protein [Bacteroidales bacterium]|nr:PAS domain S-box protein [Bacteroidales bacterium]